VPDLLSGPFLRTGMSKQEVKGEDKLLEAVGCR
jgi:hypothetical protein